MDTKTNPASIALIRATSHMVASYGLHLSWEFFVVNRLCADNGAWMNKRHLEDAISKATGKSINTAKRYISRLKKRNLVKHIGDNIITESKYRLASQEGFTNRRCVRIDNIFDYNQFKKTFILATHRYLEDGYYYSYDDIIRWAYSQGTLTAAEIMSIPDKKSKVGCAGFILSKYLNVSYSIVYGSLKGNVLLQYNKFSYTYSEFRSLFDISFFKKNSRFTYKRNKTGFTVFNRISSKSCFNDLFNCSSSRFYY